MKNIYITLSEFSVYINFNFKYNIYEHCIHDVINLSNDCKHAVNQCCDHCAQKHKHCCNVKYILVKT